LGTFPTRLGKRSERPKGRAGRKSKRWHHVASNAQREDKTRGSVKGARDEQNPVEGSERRVRSNTRTDPKKNVWGKDKGRPTAP